MANVFGRIAIACMIVQGVALFLPISDGAQRRIYWSCCGITSGAIILALAPNWAGGVGCALIFFFVFVLAAYFYSPYIKIRGKVYAIDMADEAPQEADDDTAPDSYGGLVTATKMWWLLIGVAGIAAVNVYAFLNGEGEVWLAFSLAGFVAFLAIIVGLGDASWDYPIARGQYLQLGIVTLITAGFFAVVYLVAYFIGKRRPVRRTESMEYRAHPRHRRMT